MQIRSGRNRHDWSHWEDAPKAQPLPCDHCKAPGTHVVVSFMARNEKMTENIIIAGDVWSRYSRRIGFSTCVRAGFDRLAIVQHQRHRNIPPPAIRRYRHLTDIPVLPQRTREALHRPLRYPECARNRTVRRTALHCRVGAPEVYRPA